MTTQNKQQRNMSVIAKLRKDFREEQKLKKEMMKHVVIERKSVVAVHVPSSENVKFKMVIDPKKLESTIQKACIPVEKKHVIKVIDTIPPPVSSNKNPVVPAPVLICKARNLNGTPCKCKAKIGKFCAKHAP